MACDLVTLALGDAMLLAGNVPSHPEEIAGYLAALENLDGV